MSEPSKPLRLYDEEEVGRILKRATELHQEEPSRALQRGGLSLGELQDIAREAGIDPQHLRRAALELDSGGEERSFWDKVAGDQLTLAQETVLPGELDDDGFERVVVVIQQEAREHGQASLLGRTLMWQAETASKTRTIQVVVSSREGETRIRVEERLHQLASGVLAGTTTGVGVGVGVGMGVPLAQFMGSVALGVAFPVGMIGLTYIGAREIYRTIARKRRAMGVKMLDRVVAEATDAIADARAAESEPERPLELPRG